MSLVYCIPSDIVKDNAVASSAYNRADKSSYVEGDTKTDGSSSTTSIMLSMASHGGEDPIRDAMRGAYFYSDKMGVFKSVEEGAGEEANQTYDYYWHGWMVALRPLLVFADYGDIKRLMLFAFAALMCALAVQMSRHLKRGTALAVALCAAMAFGGKNIFDVLPYAFPMMVAFAGALLVFHPRAMRSGESRNFLAVLFFVVGALTSFVDFLIIPLFTLLLPLSMYVLQHAQEPDKTSFKRLALQCLALAGCWFLGYVGLWVSKWVLGSLILGENVISEGLHKVLSRTNADVVAMGASQSFSRGTPISPAGALFRNLAAMFLGWPDAAVFAALLALAVLSFVLSGNKRKGFPVFAALAALALAPYAWYAAASNHSMIHFYFTFRLQIVTLFCMMAAIVTFFPGRSEHGEPR